MLQHYVIDDVRRDGSLLVVIPYPPHFYSMICAKRVFRCFKTIERWGNYITGAAGPFFVGLAVLLMSMGTVCFCMYLLCLRRQELTVALS